MTRKGILYLKPEEEKLIGMAVLSVLDRIEETSTNPRLNWTPETRKLFKEILEVGDGLKSKLQKLGFDMRSLPLFEDGDENEFLTKES